MRPQPGAYSTDGPRLPHRLHFVDFQVIDDARLLLQTQLQAVTAGGQGYFSSDIAHAPIYKDFRYAFVNQYLHLAPAILEIFRCDGGEVMSVVTNRQPIAALERGLEFYVKRS